MAKAAEKTKAGQIQASAALPQRGMMLILSSPSGAGKTTLSHMLRADRGLKLGISVSATTRHKRPSEKDGTDYYFVNEAEFKRLIDKNAFIEWAQVHGAYYGTLQETVDKVLQTGKDIIFDIDYQGARQIQQKQPQDTVAVFILPPSMAELRERLQARAENSAAEMKLRLRNAAEEMRHWQNYDYVLINEDLEQSYRALQAIIQAERLKRCRRPGLQGFVDGLVKAAEE